MLTVWTYYKSGANILLQLGDYSKAWEFLTIALATGWKKDHSTLFTQLLAVSTMANKDEVDISRHIPAYVFEANKAILTGFSFFVADLKLPGNFDVHSARFCEELLKKEMSLEMLGMIREFRERGFRDLRKVYLSVGSESIFQAETYQNSMLRRFRSKACLNKESQTENSVASSRSQLNKLTKDYMFQLLMNGTINGTLEETSKDDEFTVTFSQRPHNEKTGKLFSLEDQISQLHARLNEVAQVSRIMDLSSREIVENPGFQKAIKRKPSGPQEIGSPYEMGDESPYQDNSRHLFAERFTPNRRGGGNDSYDRRRSFRQMADDSQDVEGTDTSEVDTVDDNDEEL